MTRAISPFFASLAEAIQSVSKCPEDRSYVLKQQWNCLIKVFPCGLDKFIVIRKITNIFQSRSF